MSKPRFEHHNFYILFTYYLKSRLWRARISEVLNKNSNLHNLSGIKATKARISDLLNKKFKFTQFT